MAQNRKPPAYQEYAASMLSNNDFRMMSLASRGLLYTLRLEYWVGNPLPNDPGKLGKILHFEGVAVKSALIELGELIQVRDGFIRIAELDDYKNHLLDRKQKQSIGGKKGAERARRNTENRKQSSQVVAPDGDPQVTRGSTHGSLVQPSPAQSSSVQDSPVSMEEHSQWLKDYEGGG